MTHCTHQTTVYVESNVGHRAVLCRACGAVEDGRPRDKYGFGQSLADWLKSNPTMPVGAFFTVLDGKPPITDPGSTCAGYELTGPRHLLSGSVRRPWRFVQRLSLPGRPWGRFTLAHDTKWLFCGAHKTKREACDG